MGTEYLDEIAHFASDLRFADLPGEVLDRAEWLLHGLPRA